MNIKSIVSTHLILAIVLIATHTLLFNYPTPIILSGLFVMSSIYLSLLWAAGLGLLIFKKSKLFYLINSLIFSVATYSIISIFLIDYIGNKNWGTNFTFNYIVKYAKELDKLEGILPLPLSIVYLLAFIMLIFIIMYYHKSTGIVLNNIETLINKAKNKELKVKEIIYISLSFLIIPIFLHTYITTHVDTQNDMWNGEPLTDLLLSTTYIDLKSRIRESSQQEIYSLENSVVENKPNIILIIADALRADHLSSYGYKRKTSTFIDTLTSKKQAVLVKNAFSTCAESNCGILSTLGSRPLNEISPNNIKINTILKDLGYDINFILSTDHSWSGLSKNYPPL